MNINHSFGITYYPSRREPDTIWMLKSVHCQTKRSAAPNVQSEFTLLLFPVLLQFLRSRIPHLLDHPALLAHTIYQTILFDESVESGGFSLDDTSLGENLGDSGDEWEGLAGVILRQEGWYEQWVDGERRCLFFYLNHNLAADR